MATAQGMQTYARTRVGQALSDWKTLPAVQLLPDVQVRRHDVCTQVRRHDTCIQVRRHDVCTQERRHDVCTQVRRHDTCIQVRRHDVRTLAMDGCPAKSTDVSSLSRGQCILRMLMS